MTIAVVTGAAGGIGGAIVDVLRANGWQVAGLDLKPSGADLDLIVDLADPAALDLSVITDRLGAPTALVNAAGLYQATNLLDTTPEYVARVLAINVAAPIELCRQFISKHLADGTEGSIVNIASVVAHTGSDDPSYGASKGALVSLTKGLAKAYGGQGIRVNAVAPGVIGPTPMADRIPDRRQHYLDSIPAQRFGRADEVAHAVQYLLSPNASYVNGAILDVNGGLV